MLATVAQQTIEADGVFFVDPNLGDLEIQRYTQDEIEDEFTFEDEDIDEQDTSSTSKEDDSNTNGLDETDDNPNKEDE